MGIGECSPSGGVPKTGRVGMEYGNQYVSDNPDRGVPVGIGEHPSQDEECGNDSIECGMKYRSAKSRERGLWSTYPSGRAPKEEVFTAE